MVNETFRILIDDPDQGLRLIIDQYGVQLVRQISRFIHDDDELVKDVFQLTLIAIWKDHRNIGEMADPFIWIMAIARNTAYHALRGEKVQFKESLDAYEHLPCSEQADTDLVYRETREEVLLQAMQLTPREKEIFIGSKVNGMDNKELEKLHNLKPQRVRNLLSSAVRKIRKLLDR